MRLRHLFNTYLVLEALEAPDNDEDEFGSSDSYYCYITCSCGEIDISSENGDGIHQESTQEAYAELKNRLQCSPEAFEHDCQVDGGFWELTPGIEGSDGGKCHLDDLTIYRSSISELLAEADVDRDFTLATVTEALEAPENDEDDFGDGDDNLITRIYVLGDDDIYVEVLLANSGKRYYRVTSYSKPRYGQPRRSIVSIYDANTGNEVNKNDLEFLEGIEEEEAPASEYDELCWLTGKMKDHLGMYDRDEEFNRKCW